MGLLCPSVCVASDAQSIQPVSEIEEVEIIEEIETIDTVDTVKAESPYRFNAAGVVAPAVMIGVGIAGLEWKGLKNVNHKVTDALWDDGTHKKLRLDEATQLLPIAGSYLLNLCGVKGLHDYVDLTIITGTASLMLASIVYPTKDFVSSRRPDGTKFNSFPSGHSAWAFMGAEIMRREYSHVSPWIGVSGYLVATGTAFLRLYNGAHWLTDVVAGAGIGILCAEAAYWLYPAVAKHLFPGRYKSNIFLSPSVGPRSFGMAAYIEF